MVGLTARPGGARVTANRLTAQPSRSGPRGSGRWSLETFSNGSGKKSSLVPMNGLADANHLHGSHMQAKQ